MLKMTIVEAKPPAALPERGELWWLKHPNTPNAKLCIVVLGDGGGRISFVVLESGNRYTSPKIPTELVNDLRCQGYTLTKFAGTVTLSNGDDK